MYVKDIRANPQQMNGKDDFNQTSISLLDFIKARLDSICSNTLSLGTKRSSTRLETTSPRTAVSLRFCTDTIKT